MDIEKELAKRHKPNVVLASGEARIRATEEVGNKIGVSHATFERAKRYLCAIWRKGGKPSAQLGGTKQRMGVAPIGATPE